MILEIRLCYAMVEHCTGHNFDDFGSIPPTAIAISPGHTFPYFAEAVQGCTDGPGVLARRHRSCIAAQRKMDFHVIEGLAADFGASKQVLFFDEPVIGTLLSFDRALIQLQRFRPIFDTF